MTSQRILNSSRTQEGRKQRFHLPLDFSYFMEIQPKKEVHINCYGMINGCIFKINLQLTMGNFLEDVSRL